MSRTAPKRIRGIIHSRRALEMRLKGLPYTEIASALGVSQAWAYRLVAKELARQKELTSEKAMELIRLESLRLDELWKAVLPRCQTGEPRAIAAALAIMDRRARLLGLDAPVKSTSTVELELKEMSDSQLAEAARMVGLSAEGALPN